MPMYAKNVDMLLWVKSTWFAHFICNAGLRASILSMSMKSPIFGSDHNATFSESMTSISCR